MIKKTLLTATLLAFGAVGFLANPAQAEDPFCGYVGGYGYGLGFAYSGRHHQRGVASHDRIPYFALHPPVYYSGIVKRPYGISPFAAPPGIRPVEMDVEYEYEPVVVENPYYKPKESVVQAEE